MRSPSPFWVAVANIAAPPAILALMRSCRPLLDQHFHEHVDSGVGELARIAAALFGVRKNHVPECSEFGDAVVDRDADAGTQDGANPIRTRTTFSPAMPTEWTIPPAERDASAVGKVWVEGNAFITESLVQLTNDTTTRSSVRPTAKAAGRTPIRPTARRGENPFVRRRARR